MSGEIVGAIVGGLIAIISGIVGPFLQHKLSSKERKEDALRSSRHAIIQAIFEHSAYLDKFRKVNVFREAIEVPINPMARIEGIIATDFPDCHLQLAQFRLAGTVVNKWSTTEGLKLLKGEKIDLDEFAKVSDAYTLASSNLIAAVTGQKQITAQQWASQVEGSNELDKG